MDVLSVFVLTSVSGRIKRPPSTDAAPAVTAAPNPLAALPGKLKRPGLQPTLAPASQLAGSFPRVERDDRDTSVRSHSRRHPQSRLAAGRHQPARHSLSAA